MGITVYCNKCKGEITEKRLKKVCRNCLDERKELKKEKEGSILCKGCKCFKMPEDYVQTNTFKTCQVCREYKCLHNKKEDTRPSPQDVEEEEGEENTPENKQPKTTRDHKVKNQIERVLNYLKTKYKISENIQDLQHILNISF